jgi:oligopeptide/dipeptide ABC transporter ATP-binding protein
VAALKESALRNWVQSLHEELVIASNTDCAFERISVVLNLAHEDKFYEFYNKAVRNRFLGLVGQSPQLQELFLVDLQGRVALSTDLAHEGLDYSDQDFFREGLARPYTQLPFDSGEGPGRNPSSSDPGSVIAVIPVVGQQGRPLGVIAQICDRVIVMYAGNIVEAGDVLPIFEQPKHPYTQALLRSHPSRSMRGRRLRTIPGVVPSLRDLPAGCKFAPRCRLARQICRTHEPEYWEVDQQSVLCHSYAPSWKGPDALSSLEEASSEPKAEIEPERKPSETILIRTSGLHKHFQDNVGLLGQILGQEATTVKAVHGVDVAIRKGETLGLVGESGSGKTTLARTILRLTDPTMGKIVVLGKEISDLPAKEIRPLRSQMQMIFQDPTSSLSPRMKASSLLMEPYVIHNVPKSERKDPEELLAMVGLAPEQLDKYPHQLSGGQARRLGIARALALEPDIIMADEPTAGLDVSVAAGLLNLLNDLRDRLNLAYIIITHNLNVIGFISDRVAVMYLGRIVELADAEALFETPRHPYTEALLSAIPVPDPRARGRKDRIILTGEIPSPRNPPPGCTFHPRCRYAEKRCREEIPALRPLNGNGRLIACHFPDRVMI